MSKIIAGNLPFGILITKLSGLAHEIKYPRDSNLVKSFAKLTYKEKKYLEKNYGVRGQSTFYYYQYIFKWWCLVETAKICRDLGRITEEYYQYLITSKVYL